jgi:NAD(P)-dependent dehydrogenase (short-subunit alcohol dehydrogenase family)
MEERMKAADMYRVDGYGVIVTGGASGIGLSYAEVLAENGARVTMLDVHEERLDTETKRLRDKGWDVRGMKVDVTDHKALDRAFDETAKLYGRLDVVFANAGIDPGIGFVSLDRTKRVHEGAIENYEDARWNHVIDINLNGVFATIRAAARHMKPRRSGRIIVTTSIAALYTEAGIGAAYMAAKAGAAHLMRNAALELAKYNILVNAIAPGPFITNIGGGWVHRKEIQDAFAEGVPLRRVASTEEMKGLALFLASPASSYVTGAQIPIDGGCLLGNVQD